MKKYVISLKKNEISILEWFKGTEDDGFKEYAKSLHYVANGTDAIISFILDKPYRYVLKNIKFMTRYTEDNGNDFEFTIFADKENKVARKLVDDIKYYRLNKSLKMGEE